MVLADEDEVAAHAAERITALVEAAIRTRGSAVVSLTGGETPRLTYSLLGNPAHPWRRRLDWTRLHLFWGDERHVPPDHPHSNYGMARDELLRNVPIPVAQIHRIHGELSDARDAAAEYEQALRHGFAAAGRETPTFDVMLLGLGEDAHIASIFPGSELLAWRDAPADGRGTPLHPAPRVAAIFAPHLKSWRITLTPAALVDARSILMIVAGKQKAQAVWAAREAPPDVARYPAQLLREAGDRVEWIVDRPASRLLRTGSD